MLAKYNDKIHSEWASVCAADCDDEPPVARVEIHAGNHEVVARITVHRVHGIAGIVEASPELPLKARLIPKRRVIRIVEAHDLVTDKNSRRTGYGMLADSPRTDTSVYSARCRKGDLESNVAGCVDIAV